MSDKQHRADGERFTVADFVSALWVFAILGLMLLLGAELLRHLWGPLGLVCYGVGFGLVLFMAIFDLSIKPSATKAHMRKYGGESDLAATVVSLFGSAIVFGLLTFELAVTKNWGFADPSDAGRWEWILFGIQNLFEAICLGIPSIYEVNISSIEASTFGACTWIMLYRLTIDYILIKALLMNGGAILSVRRARARRAERRKIEKRRDGYQQ